MRTIFLRGKVAGPVYLSQLSKKGFSTDFHPDLCLTCVTSHLLTKDVL